MARSHLGDLLSLSLILPLKLEHSLEKQVAAVENKMVWIQPDISKVSGLYHLTGSLSGCLVKKWGCNIRVRLQLDVSFRSDMKNGSAELSSNRNVICNHT